MDKNKQLESDCKTVTTRRKGGVGAKEGYVIQWSTVDIIHALLIMM